MIHCIQCSPYCFNIDDISPENTAQCMSLDLSILFTMQSHSASIPMNPLEGAFGAEQPLQKLAPADHISSVVCLQPARQKIRLLNQRRLYITEALCFPGHFLSFLNTQDIISFFHLAEVLFQLLGKQYDHRNAYYLFFTNSLNMTPSFFTHIANGETMW